MCIDNSFYVMKFLKFFLDSNMVCGWKEKVVQKGKSNQRGNYGGKSSGEKEGRTTKCAGKRWKMCCVFPKYWIVINGFFDVFICFLFCHKKKF